MVFSSFSFLCLYLPVVLAVYYVLPKKARNLFLLIASLGFYAWGEPRYVLLMLFSIAVNYGAGILIDRNRENPKRMKRILTLSVIINIGLLCVFKYADFVIGNINRAFGTELDLLYLALPIGISFYTFQAMSYLVDVYRSDAKARRSIIDFGMYITMFPQLIAGPIVRYSDIEAQLSDRDVDLCSFSQGICRFAAGLGKKVLLANQIGALWATVSVKDGNLSALMAWLGAVAFTMQIYFDFSGYSDMAIGLGEMFGFRFPENFRYPYEAISVTDFWRRWHITLGTWFKEYLYIPLGGNRKGRGAQIFNLFAVWTLTGIWHGAGWNFLIWGLYYFVFLVAEKLFLLKTLHKAPKLLRHLYTLIIITVGWVLFSCNDLSVLLPYLGAMFGANGMTGGMDLYYLSTRAVLLVILCIFATELPGKIVKALGEKLAVNAEIAFTLKAVFALSLIACSMVFLIGDSYNPFLYFRF